VYDERGGVEGRIFALLTLAFSLPPTDLAAALPRRGISLHSYGGTIDLNADWSFSLALVSIGTNCG
jgi:hypothetical protein